MDPFERAPAELRLNILISTGSWRSIKNLIQASPIMLSQYVTHKEYINQQLLINNLGEDLLRDAIAIIRFPPPNEQGQHSAPHFDHLTSWTIPGLSEAALVDDEDGMLRAEINRLHRQTLTLIEDYITKATAACPSREYLCLPNQSGQMTFKDKIVCPKLHASELHHTELYRLFKAFLRYDLICKFKSYNGYGEHCQNLYQLTKALSRPEREALVCVQRYVESLYTAVLAQCSDFNLPAESPRGTLASGIPSFGDDKYDRQDDDTYTDDWERSSWYHLELSLSANELTQWLAHFGLDMATTLIEGTTAGHYGRAVIRQWLQDLSTRGPRYGFDREIFYDSRMSSLTGRLSYVEDQEEHDSESPGLCQMLYWRIANRNTRDQKFHLQMYRARAWVFLNDDRLHKSPVEGPYAPSVVRPRDIIGPRRETASDPSWPFVWNKRFFPQKEMEDLSSVLKYAKVHWETLIKQHPAL
ncbi:hypothetical protein F5Y16DRAFT_402527 [Xylariaceae sp. FL0255]|nr:hypothetical protein F5Y16DRAFT_402527 [Xylariaceae sp. FL0255]